MGVIMRKFYVVQCILLFMAYLRSMNNFNGISKYNRINWKKGQAGFLQRHCKTIPMPFLNHFYDMVITGNGFSRHFMF